MKNRIREFRKEKGLTQQEIASMWNVDVRVIGFMETGKTPVTSIWLERLSKLFGCRPEELISAPPPRIPVVCEVGASADFGRVLWLPEDDAAEETAPHVPHATPRTRAVRIKGVSMGRHLDGWFAYYNEPMLTPSNLLFKGLVSRKVACVVILENTECYMKVLLSSDKAGLYDLESANGELLQHQKVRSAAEIFAYARDVAPA